jgi:hypothetical protein
MGSERRLERRAGPHSRTGHPSARPKRGSSGLQRSIIERNRTLILSVVGVVVIGALILFAVLQASNTNEPTASAPAAPADPAVVSAITSLPQSLFDSIGRGSASNPPTKIAASTGSDATSGAEAQPRLLFVGGEFCPFCAAERWALVIALSRFGTFTDLSATRSASGDVYPNTATLSFYGSTYESDYLSFEAVEIYSNQRAGSGYAPLEKLTADQAAIVNRFNPGGGIPFFYINGQYVLQGTNFSPDTLSGLDWSGIADEIQQEDSPVARAVVGSANLLTAAICQATGGQPGDVCQSPGVQQAADMLP